MKNRTRVETDVKGAFENNVKIAKSSQDQQGVFVGIGGQKVEVKHGHLMATGQNAYFSIPRNWYFRI